LLPMDKELLEGKYPDSKKMAKDITNHLYALAA